jgi:reverse gyrase
VTLIKVLFVMIKKNEGVTYIQQFHQEECHYRVWHKQYMTLRRTENGEQMYQYLVKQTSTTLRDDITFPIVKFPFISKNVPASPAY